MNGAKVLILVGVLLTAVGVLWLLAPQTLPKLFGWFGHLPGDLRFERGNTSVFVPLTSMILISVALNLILRLFK